MDKKTIFTRSEDSRIAFEQDDDGLVLTGYAVVWDVLSSDRGGYKVRIKPHSFTKQSGKDVRALYAHDERYILAREKNGTLSLMPDDYGVKVRIQLPNTQFARDLAEQVKRGDIDGMSFGAFPKKTKTVTENGQQVSEYESWVLDEVTVTSIPAFTQTSVIVADPKDFSKEQSTTAEGITAPVVERHRSEFRARTLRLD